ncbi:MAG: hypothetical protein SPL12_07805 [Bacteroidales bacterium]|nr:hypothetical protein [Bacteroidales bacterium]
MYRKAPHRKELETLKRTLWHQLEKSGCLWSYATDSQDINDELLIEKALLYFEFEDLHLLREIYPMPYLRRIWRERLVSQGSYYDIINWLLAAMFFNISNPDKYLKQYGRPKLETRTKGCNNPCI